MYRKIIAVALLSLTFALPAVTGSPARFKVLIEGRALGAVDARALVIRDASALRAAWDELHRQSELSLFASPTLPVVDFKTHVVVFVRMEPQSDMDSSLEVTRVARRRARTLHGAQTVVTVEERVPETGCTMLRPLGHWAPFTLVQVEGTQEVVFKRVRKAIPCDEIPRIRPDSPARRNAAPNNGRHPKLLMEADDGRAEHSDGH